MSSQWYLRREDGSVYGPSSLSELKSWAISGRIGPNDDVSEDQTSWEPAPMLKELEMVWSLHVDNDHVFGPFNIYALIDLAEENHLSYSTDAVHLGTGKRHRLGDVLLPLLFSERELLKDQAQQHMEEELGEVRASVDALRHELRAKKEALEALTDQLNDKVQQQTTLSEKAMADHQTLLLEREAAAETLKGMEAEMRMAADVFKEKEASITSLHRQLGDVESKLAAAEEAAASLTTRLEKAEETVTARDGDLNSLREGQTELEKEHAVALTSIEALKSELASAAAASAEELEQAGQDVSRLQAELEEERAKRSDADTLAATVEALEVERDQLKQSVADAEARLVDRESALQASIDQLTREHAEALETLKGQTAGLQDKLNEAEAKALDLETRVQQAEVALEEELGVVRGESVQKLEEAARREAALTADVARLTAELAAVPPPVEVDDAAEQALADIKEELKNARAALRQRDAELAQLRSGKGARPASLIQQAMVRRQPGGEAPEDSATAHQTPKSIQSALSSVRKETLRTSKRQTQAVTSYKRKRSAEQGGSRRPSPGSQSSARRK